MESCDGRVWRNGAWFKAHKHTLPQTSMACRTGLVPLISFQNEGTKGKLYEDCLLRFCSEPFTLDDLSNRYCHITNRVVQQQHGHPGTALGSGSTRTSSVNSVSRRPNRSFNVAYSIVDKTRM